MGIGSMQPRPVIALALGLLAAGIALARLGSFGEPLERDLTTYALIAEGLAQGRPLYADLWDHKPPGIHGAYRVAQAAFGMGPAAVYALGVAMSWIALLGVYTAAAADPLGWRVGLLAAGLWALAQDDLRLGANQPNVEAFLNAISIWLFALLVRQPLDRGRGLGAGMLLGLAALFKPIAACWGLMWLPRLWTRRGGLQRDAVPAVALIALAGLAVVALCGLYFLAVGRFDAYWEATIVYNRHYAGSLAANLARGLDPQTLFHPALLGVSPLFVFAALCWLDRRRQRPPIPELAFYLAASWLAVCAPGRFHAHYYQLLLPPLCVAAAWGVAAVADFSRPRSWALPVAVAIWSLGGLQLPAHRLSPAEWSTQKSGTVFVQSERLGHWIDAVLAEGETVYNWGSETGIYYARGELPTTGILYNLPLRDGPLAPGLLERLLASLDATPPDMVVLSYEVTRGHPFGDWLEAHDYRALPPHDDWPYFLVLLRGGSALQARLERELQAQIPAGAPAG